MNGTLMSARRLLIGVPMLLLLIAVVMFCLLGSSKTASAQTVSQECRVIIALDKSSSIGAENLATLNDNVKRLITNIGNPDIYLAFWAFSHEDDSTDYNLPRHDYVRTTINGSGLDEFVDSLPKADELRGQTDYAQAYGYSAGEPDINSINDVNDIVLTPNNSPNNNVMEKTVNEIRSRADVVVMLTDGAPNYPGGTDNNKVARFAGRKARLQYPSNVTMIGGFISDTAGYVPASLYYTINGDDNNKTNVGPVSFGGGSGQNEGIYTFVRNAIESACQLGPPSDYWLKPKASAEPSAVREGDTITFNYQVDKDRDEEASRTSVWEIYDVTINPDVVGNPLDFQMAGSQCTNNTTSNGREAWCDGVSSCNVILSKLSNRGTCNRAETNSSTFSGGQNLFYGSGGRNVAVGSQALGTRICSLLVLVTPTGSGNSHRASSVACATVGKTPLVQVYGGDVRAGRHFVGDESEDGKRAGVYTSRFKISQNPATVPNGRTFGSWVEYGVLAPGPIEKIASLSGYAGEHGGYDGLISTNSCDTTVNRLTFANKVNDPDHRNECGHYKSQSELGGIPDVISSLKSGAIIDASLYTTPLQITGSSPDSNNGQRYDSQGETDFEIRASTLVKGKTYIVHAPKARVIITGNITYENAVDTYSDVREIPQLIIIAKNIAIRENVTQVNAWLVAAGEDGREGVLDTCTGITPPLSSEKCNQQLVINGPVMARELHLWRTKVQQESCRIEVITDCSSAGEPAEIFNLPGSSILWTHGFNDNSARARTTSTIELPPYF